MFKLARALFKQGAKVAVWSDDNREVLYEARVLCHSPGGAWADLDVGGKTIFAPLRSLQLVKESPGGRDEETADEGRGTA